LFRSPESNNEDDDSEQDEEEIDEKDGAILFNTKYMRQSQDSLSLKPDQE